MGTERTAVTNRYCPKCDGEVGDKSEICPRCSLERPDDGWPVDPLIGTAVSEKYRIKKRIGRGGMGSVYLAEQTYEGKSLGKVAIKFLQPLGTPEEQEFLKNKFVSEARLARLFNNPHIIKIYDFGTHRGLTYMAMEFLKGETLQDRLLRQKKLYVPTVIDIALQIAEALAEVHRHDVVHRDIKPENILILNVKGEDFVKILDFGIAKKIEPGGVKPSTQVGTPMYMPPEQVRGKPVDARADVYALGILMYHCLVGNPPIMFENIYDMYSHSYTSTPPPDIGKVRTSLPEGLTQLINAMIRPDPAERPSSAGEVSETLRMIARRERKEEPLPRQEHPLPVSTTQDTQVYDSDSSSPAETTSIRTPSPTDFTAFHADRRKRTGLVIGAGIALLLVLGAGAYTAVRFVKGRKAEEPVSMEIKPVSTGVQAPAKAAVPDPVVTGAEDASTAEEEPTAESETPPPAEPSAPTKRKKGKKKIVVSPKHPKPPPEEPAEDKPPTSTKWKSIKIKENSSDGWKK
jgi:serine/threonine-protein kinase